MVDNTDFAATFLDCAGVGVPETMQGRSFRPVLGGATPVDWRRSVYYRYPITLAGHPATTFPGGTSFVTTDPAPTTAFSLISTPGRMMEPAPM